MVCRNILIFFIVFVLALSPVWAGKGGKKGGGKKGGGKKSMGKKGCEVADSRTGYYYQRMANAFLTEVSEAAA